ncbi:hypothetical protein [Sorangium sp. So ce513]|uniref:hypothetical protein n=1 Tax=Sorangium sp. So ce513 TaxID=3133315 RepID=UPI003F62E0BC
MAPTCGYGSGMSSQRALLPRSTPTASACRPVRSPRCGTASTFGFHGLHLRTEAVAAFGELLLADAGTATATWVTLPLTTSDLELHLRSPLMTRPDVA